MKLDQTFINILKGKLESKKISIEIGKNNTFLLNTFKEYYDNEKNNAIFLNSLNKNIKIKYKNKNICKHLLLNFIKYSNISNFKNIYDIFFKENDPTELFNYIQIKKSYITNDIKENHLFQPYLLFFLNQDYRNNKCFSSSFFLEALNFNFKVNDKNYSELQSSLFSFIATHINEIKQKNLNNYNTSESEKKIKEFDLSIYREVIKHIKEEDLIKFEQFWPSIIIDKKSDTLITVPTESFFVFNIEYGFLSKKYQSITNQEYAKKACEFVVNFLNNNIENIKLTYLSDTQNSSQIICQFKTNKLNKDNLNFLIDFSISTMESCKILENYHLKHEYNNIYKNKIEELKKNIQKIELENILVVHDKQVINKNKI